MGYQVFVLLQHIICFHSFISYNFFEVKKSLQKNHLKKTIVRKLENKSYPTQKIKKGGMKILLLFNTMSKIHISNIFTFQDIYNNTSPFQLKTVYKTIFFKLHVKLLILLKEFLLSSKKDSEDFFDF